MNAQLAGTGVKIGNINKTGANLGTPVSKAVINNPIELPEKK